jgi:hypothetical protein
LLGVAVGGLDTVPGQRSAVVRWSASGALAALGGFDLTLSNSGGVLAQRVVAGAREARFDGLQPGTTYAVQVLPLGVDGRSDRGAAVTTTLTTLPAQLGAPQPPSGVTLSPGPGSLTVTWSADPGDLATTEFFVSWGCCGGFLGGVSVDRDARSYTIAGLASGVEHVVEVQSIDSNLVGDISTKRTARGVPA